MLRENGPPTALAIGPCLRPSRLVVDVCGQAVPKIHNVVMDLPVTGTRHFQDAIFQHFVGVVVAMFAVWMVRVGHSECHVWSLP